jgi:hypothetical protein
MKGNDWTMAYEHRKDFRTDGEFARDILNRTAKENNCVRLWFANWIKPTFADCQLIDNGIDNSGAVVTGRGDFGAADFGLKFPGKPEMYYIEAKASFGDVLTLKCESITAYERRYADRRFRLLAFINTSRGEAPGRSTQWCAIPIEDFHRVTTEGRYQKHDPAFGGKATFRLGEGELLEFWELNRLFPVRRTTE